MNFANKYSLRRFWAASRVVNRLRKIFSKKIVMNDFVAIDFETANQHRTSVCSVGIAIVRNGKVVDKFYSLVKPEPNFYTRFTTEVHGLVFNDTCNADSFDQVWNNMQAKIQDLPLVAHNKSFDESCLKACLKHYGVEYIDNGFYCTLQESRKQIQGLVNYKLPTVAKECGYDLTNHHDALADAEACAYIGIELFCEKGIIY